VAPPSDNNPETTGIHFVQHADYVFMLIGVHTNNRVWMKVGQYSNRAPCNTPQHSRPCAS